MNPDLHEFKKILDSEITSLLKKEIGRYRSISNDKTILSLLEHQNIVAAGGKRIRPFLVFAVFAHSNPQAKPEDLMELLLAVELFHVFCLIHDDVMDEAVSRHGAPTIHTYAEASFYFDRHRAAESQAILVGDILFNSVFRLLHAFLVRHPHYSSITSLFHTLIDEVCLGQMIDVDLTTKDTTTLAHITEKNRLKTAYYSIVRPLQLGLLLSGRDDLHEFARLFGEQLGLLYQVQDDLLDVTAPPDVSKKPQLQDVAQNQHTILRTYIEEKGGEWYLKLKYFLGKPVLEEDIPVLQAIFSESGAIQYATSCIDAYAKNAEVLIQELERPEDRELFAGIMNLIYKRTH